MRISNTYRVFQILLCGVPQGSILGPFTSLYLWASKTDLLNFAKKQKSKQKIKQSTKSDRNNSEVHGL